MKVTRDKDDNVIGTTKSEGGCSGCLWLFMLAFWLSVAIWAFSLLHH